MELGTRLYVHKDDVTDIEALDALLTIDNPEYQSAARFKSRFTSTDSLPDPHINFIFEDDKGYYFPRNVLLFYPQFFKRCLITDLRSEGAKLNKPVFRGSFAGDRVYQQRFVDLVEHEAHEDLLLEVPCGHGKTVLGAYYTAVRGVATLIMVPTRQIAAQWLSTFEKLTNIRAVILDPKTFNKIDIKTVEAGIMSFDLFESRKERLPQEFVNHWGHVILDEAHVVGAPTYQPVLYQIPCMYRLAMTATFRRTDGMDKILALHFGKQYTMENQFAEPVCYPVQTNFSFKTIFPFKSFPGGKRHRDNNVRLFKKWLQEQSFYWKEHQNGILEVDGAACDIASEELVSAAHGTGSFSGAERVTIRKLATKITEQGRDGSFVTACTLVAGNDERNKNLLAVMDACLEAGRKVLFLSLRKESLKKYAKQYATKYKTGLILGGKTEATTPEYLEWCRKEAQVVFGIAQLAKMGLDIDTLDTLVLEHPMRDLEQPAGRINRYIPGKKSPVIVWPYDNFPVFRHMYSDSPSVTRNVSYRSASPVGAVIKAIKDITPSRAGTRIGTSIEVPVSITLVMLLNRVTK